MSDELTKMIGQLLDEKLKPLRRDLVEIRTLTRVLSGSMARIYDRVAVIEAILGIEPDR